MADQPTQPQPQPKPKPKPGPTVDDHKALADYAETKLTGKGKGGKGKGDKEK